MTKQSVPWKTGYDAALYVLTGERPDSSECRRKAIALDVAHDAMNEVE